MNDIFVTVMAGGSGTRFWPASRHMMPKQLLCLASPDESLLAGTVRRVSPLAPAERVYVVTAERLGPATASDLGADCKIHTLLEPAPRNTAPCIAWTTWLVAAQNPDAVMVVLPSDQHMTDDAGFVACLERAVATARTGVICTVGIAPTRPETGFGYIEMGDAMGPHAQRVSRFVEKPSRDVAEQYLASGRYLWNAGIFVFRVGDMQAALRTHMPELASGIEQMLSSGDVAGVFPRLPAQSIDYGVMEKLDQLAVVRGDFGWSDLGSWMSAWELGPKDEHGNDAGTHGLVIDGTGNIVRDLRTHGQPRVIALVGVHDLAVVQTDDALLVLPKDKAQDVRKVVEALKARGNHGLL